MSHGKAAMYDFACTFAREIGSSVALDPPCDARDWELVAFAATAEHSGETGDYGFGISANTWVSALWRAPKQPSEAP